MKRRFLTSSDKSVVIGPGTDPMLVDATGAYIYDIYGKIHNVSDWPAGYQDEAAGIFVQDDGMSGYNDHLVYFVMAKGQPYYTDVRVDSSVYYTHTTVSAVSGEMQGNMTIGHINNLKCHYGRVTSGSSLLFQRCYNADMCCLNLTIDGNTWFNFHPYVPGLDEARLFVHMRSAINEALARIGERTLDQINPGGLPVNIGYATYSEAMDMNWDTGEPINKNVNVGGGILIPVYEQGIYDYNLIPTFGMYLDAPMTQVNGYNKHLFSVDLMGDIWDSVMYDGYGYYDHGGVFFGPVSTVSYTWGESDVNTSNANFTVDTASNDTDGVANTEVLRGLDPGPGTMIDVVGDIQTSFGTAKGHVPAFGELGKYMDDGAIQWVLARLCGFYRGVYSSDKFYWTSTEVNRNRGIAALYYNDQYSRIRLEPSSKLKSDTYQVLPIFDLT